MRKADYSTLAAIVRQDAAEMARASENINDPRLAITAAACRTAVQNVARQFAKSASVNPAEFLKACGIEP